MQLIPISKAVGEDTATALEIRPHMVHLFKAAPVRIYYAYYNASGAMILEDSVLINYTLSSATYIALRQAVSTAVGALIINGVLLMHVLYNTIYKVRYLIPFAEEEDFITLVGTIIPKAEEDAILEQILAALDITPDTPQGIGYWTIESNFTIS